MMAVLIAYVAGLFDWIQAYSNEFLVDRVNSIRNTVKVIALVAYAYFGIRFFNRHVSEQVY